MLYQSWFYLTGFIFWLTGLTFFKSECYTPIYGISDNFTLAAAVEFSYNWTHISIFYLFYALFCWIFSCITTYDTHISPSICLSIIIFISLECWFYIFLDLFSNIHSETHGAVLVGFSDIPPCCLVYLSVICMTKEHISFRLHLLLWQVEKKSCRDALNSNFQEKCVWREKKLE